jgi:hypothetical protein
MESRMRVRLLVVLAVASLASAAVPLLAQDAGKAKAKRAARKDYDATRRLPSNFSRLGLTVEQREAIFKVRAQHLERIEALQQQIEDEEEKMMADSEAVLTDQQRTTLEVERAKATGRPTTGTAPPKAAGKAKGAEKRGK